MKYVYEKAVIIFARYPEPGKVKTRLAATLGSNFASEFYRLCTEHIFNQCKKLIQYNINVYLFYADKNDIAKINKWVGNNFAILPQTGNDLGERMISAFNTVFGYGFKKAVIIGTDVPDISAGLILDAFNSFDEFDSVIGPSKDGGYYLLGLKKVNPDFFSSITWSSNNVFRETINRMKNFNYKIKTLPLLTDIDTEEDLREWFYDENDLEINPVKLFCKTSNVMLHK